MRNSTFLSECVTKLPRGSQVYTVTPTTHLVSLSQRLGCQSISEAEVLRHGELYYIRIRQNTSIEVYWDTEVQGGGNEWGEFSVGTCEYIPRPSWIVRVSKVLILSPLLRIWTLRIFTTSTSVSFRNDLLTFYQPRVLSKTHFLYISLKSTTQYPFIPCTSLHVPLSRVAYPHDRISFLSPLRSPQLWTLIDPISTILSFPDIPCLHLPTPKLLSTGRDPNRSPDHTIIPKEAISSKVPRQTKLRTVEYFYHSEISKAKMYTINTRDQLCTNQPSQQSLDFVFHLQIDTWQ